MKRNTHRLLRPLALALALVCALLSPVTSLSAQADATHGSALPVSGTVPEKLIPGGMPFGVRLRTAGILVVGLSEIQVNGRAVRPAYDAGVRPRDILLSIDGTALSSAEEATQRIAAAKGQPVRLTLSRNGQEQTLTVTPQKCDTDGQYRCGLWLKDSTSGIGTVTFLYPDSGLFGGLGHGICDSETGALMPLSHGQILDVRIHGAIRGTAGRPGELQGTFTGQRLGKLVSNSECGVCGILHETPQTKYGALPVATAAEVQPGAAVILCTLGDDGIGEYAVELSSLDPASDRPTRSFVVHVTDRTLLSRTGGIVQGMSGSPILQNGKIVGAVTHVLVDDPTTGYGIYMENMLAHMRMRTAA